MAKGKNVLTTGEVAKICNVAPRTVSKWFDSGRLKGYRIPGSKDRRIPINELTRFMKAHNIPITALPVGNIRVLLVDSSVPSASKLAENLRKKADYDVQMVSTNFETGLTAQRFAPHVLLISLSAPDINADDICNAIRADEDLQTVKIIAMGERLSESEAAALLQKGYDGYVADPANVDEVIKKVEEATAIIY